MKNDVYTVSNHVVRLPTVSPLYTPDRNRGKGVEKVMRVLRNYDVASYYPHLMTLYGYSSRNIPSSETFADVLERRLKAKAEGDKALDDPLKLVLNKMGSSIKNTLNANQRCAIKSC